MSNSPVRYTASGMTAMVAAISARSNHTTVVGSRSATRGAQVTVVVAASAARHASAMHAGWPTWAAAAAAATTAASATAVRHSRGPAQWWREA